MNCDIGCVLHYKIHLKKWVSMLLMYISDLGGNETQLLVYNVIFVKFFKCVWVVYNRTWLTQKKCYYDFSKKSSL